MGDFELKPNSFSGDGDEPPAEFRRDDGLGRNVLVSKCLNRNGVRESSVLLNKNASGHEIHERSRLPEVVVVVGELMLI